MHCAVSITLPRNSLSGEEVIEEEKEGVDYLGLYLGFNTCSSFTASLTFSVDLINVLDNNLTSEKQETRFSSRLESCLSLEERVPA
jgi:hypothetical protein